MFSSILNGIGYKCHPEFISGSLFKQILKQVQNDRKITFIRGILNMIYSVFTLLPKYLFEIFTKK